MNEYSITQKVGFRLSTDWKQIYTILQYKVKAFAEVQALACFPRNIILHSPTKFGIRKPYTNIQSLWRFHLVFWKTSKQIYRKLEKKEKLRREFQALPSWYSKMILYSLTKFCILKTWWLLHGPNDSIYSFDRLQNNYMVNCDIGWNLLEKSKLRLVFPE